MKRITQKLFDETVQETMEDFEMEMKEAIEDTKQQFLRQGVNLENIDFSGGVGKEEVLRMISILFKVSSSNDEIVSSIKELRLLCDEKKCTDMWMRNQRILHSEGCFSALYRLLEAIADNSVRIAVLELLSLCCASNSEYRDDFGYDGSRITCSLMQKEKLVDAPDLFLSCMKLVYITAKSENNKVMLMKCCIDKIIINILTDTDDLDSLLNIPAHIFTTVSMSDLSMRLAIIAEASRSLRRLCTHDDTRSEMSCAFDNGKFFIATRGLVPALFKLASQFTRTELRFVASSTLSAARALVTTEEAVVVVAEHGAMTLPSAILTHFLSNSNQVVGSDDSMLAVSLVRSSLGLLRNLCADDIRKDRLVSNGTMNLVVRAVGDDNFNKDSNLVEHGLATLAAMSLRSPSNATRIVSAGAVNAIAKCCRIHDAENQPANPPVVLLRQACLLVRNIAARCPEFRETFLDAGLEGLLRRAGRLVAVVDEAYAALRDLGCEVKMIKFSSEDNADGVSVEDAFESFGEIDAKSTRKPKFNPVYEESCDIEERVRQEARAPFPTHAEGSSHDGHSHDGHDHTLHCA